MDPECSLPCSSRPSSNYTEVVRHCRDLNGLTSRSRPISTSVRIKLWCCLSFPIVTINASCTWVNHTYPLQYSSRPLFLQVNFLKIHSLEKKDRIQALYLKIVCCLNCFSIVGTFGLKLSDGFAFKVFLFVLFLFLANSKWVYYDDILNQGSQ